MQRLATAIFLFALWAAPVSAHNFYFETYRYVPRSHRPTPRYYFHYDYPYTTTYWYDSTSPRYLRYYR